MQQPFAIAPGSRYVWSLVIALAACLPTRASAVGRDEVMKEAARFAEHTWEMRAANQKGSCQGKYKSDQPLGSRKGVPYAWGGWMSVARFDERIAAGHGAGSHSRDGILSCVAGVDCSGFVSQVWKLPQRQTTSSLASVTRTLELEELRPGDALNKAGSHVVLFAGLREDGTPIIYEASGSASRVRLATPGWSYLSGYQPVRYKAIEESVAQSTPAAQKSAPAAQGATGTQLASAVQPASTANRLSLRYGKEVGFQPAAVDEQAIGPDYLAAGPGGIAAVYDRVRDQVLVLARDGVRKTFASGHADGLGFTEDGNVLVMDGAQHQLRAYRTSGELLWSLPIPHEGLLGALQLENGVLYVTTPDGQRKIVAELNNGKLMPPAPNAKLPDAPVFLWKGPTPEGGRRLEVNGESLSVPVSAHVAGRIHGKWLELMLVTTDGRGNVNVERTLRRPGQVVALPGGQRGAYTPIADLAVDARESAVYLEPGDKAVSVVWVDPVR